jgi:hypothetical protein
LCVDLGADARCARLQQTSTPSSTPLVVSTAQSLQVSFALLVGLLALFAEC